MSGTVKEQLEKLVVEGGVLPITKDLKTKLFTNKSDLMRYEIPNTVANLKQIEFLCDFTISSA
jgi:hypothetical protein